MTSVQWPSAESTFIPIKSRRVNLRVAASLPVVLVFGANGGDFIKATTVDVGMGGLCVKTQSIVDGSLVRTVRFFVGEQKLDLAVEARWASPGRRGEGLLTGFSFESISPEDESALWDFIQKRGRELGSFIRCCEGLSYLSFEESLELALETRLREVNCGETIYGTDEAKGGTSIFIDYQGTTLLERMSGSRSEEIATLNPGAIFGGLPIVAGYPPIERAIAITQVTLLEFDQFSCEHMIGAKPLLAAALLRAASFHWMRRLSDLLDRTKREQVRN